MKEPPIRAIGAAFTRCDVEVWLSSISSTHSPAETAKVAAAGSEEVKYRGDKIIAAAVTESIFISSSNRNQTS